MEFVYVSKGGSNWNLIFDCYIYTEQDLPNSEFKMLTFKRLYSDKLVKMGMMKARNRKVLGR